jgi:hypothetical protein
MLEDWLKHKEFVLGEVKTAPKERFHLIILGSGNWEEETSFSEKSEKEMEDLKAILYLLDTMLDDEMEYEIGGEKEADFTEKQKWTNANKTGNWSQVQQHIIFEAGKKTFLSYLPSKPICCLFPMGEGLTRKEYPEFAEGHWDGLLHAQVMDNGYSVEWPLVDEDEVVIHTYLLYYFDHEGVKWECRFKEASAKGEKESG